ncbi:methyltransferase, TIGR04325 family [Mucilaginibacter sp. BT774]|uniref:methyltransferase, TIGR04325 family n=1 Tax=Mucilaginibacter sp. BT774 TaxID=3062276 RepID=UPI0026758D22|nr:methyltransferase, TIGR04325 family [Mucilaginibacter sp. BT774]MDO3627496.1 methyltransferase, TIGR04325 family [Mucilaginibacter sp. BT774]
MQTAPIILFVYKRPTHTEKVLTALAENILADASELYIFCDGPKDNAPSGDIENIVKTREIIKKKKWCKNVYISESSVNKGLATSVIDGVTEVVNKYGKVIVLEDDIIPSKYFLQFMNDALNIYQHDEKVLSIGAFNFFATDSEVGETFFIPIPDCWGWATWKDQWALFEPNPQKLLDKLRQCSLIEKFNLYGAYNFEKMLIDQIRGNISSWAIRWQAVAYLYNKLTLYPKFSVTKNIGFDSEGTHGGDDKYSNVIRFATHRIKVEKIPVQERPEITKRMMQGYFKVTQPQRKTKIKAQIKRKLFFILPPVLASIYRKFRPSKLVRLQWQGNYQTWEEAKEATGGYNDPNIFEITRKAVLKVKKGEAKGERDSVLFEEVQQVWPVTAHLLKIILENNGRLRIIDFGGSLGSSYFQNRAMIPANVILSWNVVEQDEYVKIGNAEIADNQLHFFSSINQAYEQSQADTILLSSVLQYLEKPYEFLDEILNYGFTNIIIDRTAFIDGPQDLITAQTVPESIYKASYPAWFFCYDHFKSFIKKHYEIIHEFNSEIDTPINLDNQIPAYWKGFILKRTV